MNTLSMRRAAIFTIMLGTACTIQNSYAAAPNETLSECLSNQTTGQDRKALVKWMFIALSNHPELKSMTQITTKERETINQNMAQLITELLTKRCTTQARAIIATQGAQGLEASFKSLGEIAMRELTFNPEFITGIAEYGRYVDEEKMKQSLGIR